MCVFLREFYLYPIFVPLNTCERLCECVHVTIVIVLNIIYLFQSQLFILKTAGKDRIVIIDHKEDKIKLREDRKLTGNILTRSQNEHVIYNLKTYSMKNRLKNIYIQKAPI